MAKSKIMYCENYDAKNGTPAQRSCSSYEGETKVDAKGQKYILIQDACNGYSANGREYDGQSFAFNTSCFKTSQLIAAQDYNQLVKAINRELERRKDCNDSTGMPVTGTIADDRGEWHDDDFSLDYLDVPSITESDTVQTSQVRQLVDSFIAAAENPDFKLSDSNAAAQQLRAIRIAVAGDTATGQQLTDVANALSELQDECACYTDCNGYAVCFCYSHCNHY